MPFLPRTLLAAALLGAAVRAGGAPPERDKVFLAEKREILSLVCERVRTAPSDYQRAVKRAEDRLRRLHDDYRVAKSTPPTALDGDVRELLQAAQWIRLERTRGRDVAPDPQAVRLIARYWREYRLGYEDLLAETVRRRDDGEAESRLYWDATKRYARLRTTAEDRLLFNAPPGRSGLDEALDRDEWALLKAMESPGKKTRGTIDCVTAPGEHPREANVDAAPFYRAQGLLPATPPLRTGAFSLPPGCRTVTQREPGARLIFRVSRGRGIAYIGSSEKELVYGYAAVPPDAPYYFENVSDEPLDLEYVALGL